MNSHRPHPLRVLDDRAAIARSHAEPLLDGVRHRHAMQDVPADEIGLHQDEHCLCRPDVELMPHGVDGAYWIVNHVPVLDYEDVEHED